MFISRKRQLSIASRNNFLWSAYEICASFRSVRSHLLDFPTFVNDLLVLAANVGPMASHICLETSLFLKTYNQLKDTESSGCLTFFLL